MVLRILDELLYLLLALDCIVSVQVSMDHCSPSLPAGEAHPETFQLSTKLVLADAPITIAINTFEPFLELLSGHRLLALGIMTYATGNAHMRHIKG